MGKNPSDFCPKSVSMIQGKESLMKSYCFIIPYINYVRDIKWRESNIKSLRENNRPKQFYFSQGNQTIVEILIIWISFEKFHPNNPFQKIGVVP